MALGSVLLVVALVANRGDDATSSDSTTSTAPASSTSSAFLPEVPAATDVPSGATTPTTPAGIGVGWVPADHGRRVLRGFSQVAATVTASDGTVCQLCLLAASSPRQRERGLMEVTDRSLGGHDGMLFTFAAPENGAFWMFDTPMPLSIAYFDAQGTVVTTTDMAPCGADPDCPPYPAGAPYGYVLEVPQGRLEAVGVKGRATIRIDGFTCPLARP